MTDFATLVLAADTRQMTQAERAIDGVTRAGSRAETQVNKTSNAISNMDKMARRAALGAVALVGSIVALTRSSANQIDALSKQAAQVGILTRNFQAMSLVANEAGVSTENLTNMIGLMQRNIVELGRGTASQTRAFQQLGVTLKDLQGLSPDAQFDRIATALAGVQDPAQRTALAMEVFGRSGRAAINMLEGYTEALEDARRFQEGFGLAVGQTSAQAIERANDAMDRLMSGFRGLGNLLAVELAPRMERFANSMIETIIQADAIRRTADVLVAVLERVGFYAGAAAIAFGAYKVATIAATVATIGLSGALVVARAALLRLGLGVIIVAAGELAFRISKLIESTGGWGNALSLLGDVASGVWEGITTSASAIGPALGAIFEDVKSTFFVLMESLTAKWRDFLSMLSGAIANIPGAEAISDRLALSAQNADEAVTGFMRSANDAEEAAMRLRRESSNLATSGFDRARAALGQLRRTVDDNTSSTEDGTDAANALASALDNVSDGAGGAGAAVKGLNDELQQTPQWVTGVSDAFADLVMRGFKDFASFAQSVVNTFRNMLRDMIAMAARNRIMISLGMGGAAVPGMAAAGVPGIGGMMSGAVGSFGGGAGMAGFAGGAGFLGGVGNVIGGLASGGLAGGGAAIGSALAGATTGLSGLAMAAGAVAVPLLAVAAVVSFFGTKTKELDRGLIVTVENMDTLVQSFRTVERSRFWGLSKRVSTTMEAAADEIANPIIDAVSQMQQGALDAAAALGIGADAFAGFTHEINLSLKGLNEQQAMQKVAEELGKMGDAFAAMVPGIQSLNELLAVAEERFELENRLMRLQGQEAQVLVRMREREMRATHALNQSLLAHIHAVEDAQQAVANAFAGLRRAVDAEKDRLRDGFVNIIDAIDERLRLANDAARASAGIFNALDRALRERRGRHLTDAIFAQRRVAALAFLQSQQGMQVTDEQALNDALSVVAEPSSKLFSNFTDYQRDFSKTSLLIDELRGTAKNQLDADEQTLQVLQEERIATQARFDEQMQSLDRQLETMERQFNAMMGVDDSVKSVAQAVRSVEAAINALAAAMVAAQAAKQSASQAGAGGGSATAGAQSVIDKLYQAGGYSKANQQVYQQWVDYAASQGTQKAIETWQSLGNKGTVDKFAAGGLHSGGARLVGERGPELEVTGSSRIYSNSDTMNMLSNAPVVLELRRLKRELEQMRDEQRQLGIQTATNTDRSYRILRSWDVVGLPEERTA